MGMIGYMFKMINDGYFLKKIFHQTPADLPRSPLRLWPQFWPGPTGRRAASCRWGGPARRTRPATEGWPGRKPVFF